MSIPPPSRDPADWAARLRAIAAPELSGTPLGDPPQGDAGVFAEGFADERGDRRAVDAPLLAHMLGLPGSGQVAGPTGDVRLWSALGVESPDPLSMVAPRSEADPSPLLPDEKGIAIEAWTESELCALHALAHHASRANSTMSGRLWERCRDAASYHMAELQPDNATNHPWSIGVFLWIWCDEGLHEARLHGETLLHNCIAGSARADRFSACVLLDAARWLDARPS
ncbi:MAG: hypothetical protein AAGG07_03850 [Planctomycetota bacterium]